VEIECHYVKGYRQMFERREIMIANVLWPCLMLTVLLISPASVALAATSADMPQLLAGDRVLLGTVEEIRSEQARIDTGEVEPRFVPMNVRKNKGLPALKPGDQVEITVNDQNLLVDVHVSGETNHHRVVRGQLAATLQTGHDKAVIRTTNGQEEQHPVRPVARSKVASIPVGADAVFLIDSADTIVDVTFGSREAVHRAAELWQKKAPLKGNLSQIRGVISKPLDHDTIAIRTEDGNEQPYEVRPLVQQRLAHLSKGDAVVLLVDEEHKVTDVAFVPTQKQ
jgi:hypothetical protein